MSYKNQKGLLLLVSLIFWVMFIIFGFKINLFIGIFVLVAPLLTLLF